MKENKLSYDCCRCLGTDCEVAYKCLRYVARFTGGPRTATSDKLCDTDAYSFIPVYEDNSNSDRD